MKLRSGAQPANDQANEMPSERQITVRNGNPSLLRLPAEIKNMIYGNLIGNEILHLRGTYNDGLEFLPCEAKVSHSAVFNDFNASSNCLLNVNLPCHRREALCYFWGSKDLDQRLLLTCRQIYHEARSIFWGTNTFSFTRSQSLQDFISSVKSACPSNLTAIRALHLNIAITRQPNEEVWNRALEMVSKELKSLARLHIIVDTVFDDEQLYRHPPQIKDMNPQPSYQKDTTQRNSYLLRGLYALRTLPIREMTIVVVSGVARPTRCASYTWTQGERQIWARYMVNKVLRK